MATQFNILAKVRIDTADIQSQLDNLRNNTIHINADTDDFELSLSVANAVMRKFIDLAGQMIDKVYELDTSLTEFKKVSDLRGSGLENYVDQLEDLGSTVARTTSEMVDAAAMFRKSGFTDAESAQLAQIASIFQNVADTQLSAEQAASSIVSQIQAFGRGMIEPIHIIDAYNNVANNFAVGTGDLSKAMELASAGLATYGNSFENILGLVTSGSEILQGRSSQVARGLTTIAARIAGDDGKGALAEYGIEVEKLDGSLRSTYEILGDVAEIWGDLSDAQRVALGEVLAGKTRYNILAAVLQNFQHAVEATETAVNSSGSALKENEAYMESLESKTTLLSATFQNLANDVIPKQLIANGLSVLNKFLEILDSDLGVIITRITLLTGIGWGITSLVKAANILPAIIGQFTTLIGLFTGATTAATGFAGALATIKAVALPIITILTAVGVAIYSIVENARKNKQAIDEMSSSAKEFKESIDNLNKSATEEKAKIEATTTSVDIYLKRIEELDKKSHLNNAEQAEYHALLQKIVEIMPSVASSIDLQNDRIIGGTSAIYDQIEAWKKLAQQQAYQTQMTELYQNKANIEFQLAQQRIKLMEKQAQYEALPATDTAIYGFWTQWFDPNEKKRKQTANEIKNIQNAIAALESQLSSAGTEIKLAEETLLNIYKPENIIPDYDETARSIGEWIEGVKEIQASYEHVGETVKVTTEEEKEKYTYIQRVIEEIKFSMDEYISSSEKYISLLSSQYELLELQGASQEELATKVKEIQDARHKEAEILRTVLDNAEVLELTQEDIYEINTKINECSIDWWNWQNKIKTDAEEIKEEYENITDVLQELISKEREELNTQKEAITSLASQMSYYYDEQINEIDAQINALREANQEIENQISLQQKLDALARAKQKRVLVYTNGQFQYVGDIDSVSSASKDLANYRRQQQLENQIAGLEEQKAVINGLKESWSGMVSEYEKEQDRWLISQELGIDTALDGWQRLVGGAEQYAQRYKEIMSSLSALETAESNLRDTNNTFTTGTVYDPNLDYHALMLQSKSAAEVAHWAKLREAKIKGEGITPDVSTTDILKEWHSANSGLSLTGGQGTELGILNNGDSIIPESMTSNLLDWGSTTPNRFKAQTLGEFNNGMQVTIQALNLPNVSDGIGFVDYVRNNMFGQVLSLVH